MQGRPPHLFVGDRNLHHLANSLFDSLSLIPCPISLEVCRPVLALNIGQPDIATPGAILDRPRSYPEPYVPYGPSQGLPEFIEALRTYYARVGVTLDKLENYKNAFVDVVA